MSDMTPLIKAIPNLVDYWPGDDVSGGVAPSAMTSGGRPMTLTNVTAGAVLTKGGGPSMRFDGTTSRAATANLAGGDAMRFPADASFSVGCVITLGAPSGLRNVFGRNTAWTLRQSNISFLTVLAKGLNLPGGGVAGTPTQVTLVFDGREIFYYSNGILELTAPAVLGTADDVASPVELFSLSGAPAAAGDGAEFWVAGTAVGHGYVRRMAEVGMVNLPTPPIVRLARAAADTKAPAGQSPEDGDCRQCPAPIRKAEPGVSNAVGTRHVGCYGGRARGVPVVRLITSNANAATSKEIGGRCAQTLYDNLHWKAAYHFDGKNWALPAPTGYAEIAGFASAAGALHWLSGYKKDSWMRRLAALTIEQFVATQITVGDDAGGYHGGSQSPVIQLGFGYILQAYLLIKDTLSASTKSRLLDSFEKAGDWLVRVQKGYYVNGNIENAEMQIFALLYRITGTAKWLNAYNAQRAISIDPPPGTGNTGGVNSIYGWVQDLAATQPDGSDGRGYFVESKQTGNPAEVGFDKIYGEVQAGHLAISHMWYPDPEIVPYINGLVNKVGRYVNFTDATATPPAAALAVDPYRIDATGGARNNYVSVMTCHAFHYATRKLGRSTTTGDLAGFNAGSWISEMEKEWRNNRGSLGNYARGLGEMWVPTLIATDLWPGMPD